MTVSVDLEVDDDVTMEDAVVEDEVCLKIVMIDEYALLAMLKTETLTEFHEELFDLVEGCDGSPWVRLSAGCSV